jgi:hypothetical protein
MTSDSRYQEHHFLSSGANNCSNDTIMMHLHGMNGTATCVVCLDAKGRWRIRGHEIREWR